MRNVGIALSLSVAAACSSTPEQERAESAQEPLSSATPEDAGDQSAAVEVAPDAEAQWRAIDLGQQKQALLVEQHLANAASLKAQLRLDEAERELTMALELDPDNLGAKQELAEVGALLGRPAGSIKTVTEDLSKQYELSVQQLQVEAEDSLRKGKLMLGRGDCDGAIAELTLCQDHIRWAPYSIDWRGLDKEVAALLAQAKQAQGQAADTELRDQQEQAYTRLKAEEQAEQQRQKAVIDNMLAQAIASFDSAEYDQAMGFADEALLSDPRNTKAQEIRDSAFRAGREQLSREFLVKKREQFARWRTELDELRVPYTNIVTLPDRAYWEKITELRSKRAGYDLESGTSPEELELRTRLATTRVPALVIESESSLQAVIGALRTITGLPLVVDATAEDSASEAGVEYNLNFTNPLTADKILNQIVGMSGDDVTWTIKHDVVLVTTKEKARGELVIKNHDVQDLIVGLTDFIGPRIDRLRLLEEMEDEDGGGPFGTIGEKPTIIEPEDLKTLIQENVAVGTWEQDGVSINVEMGNMIISHTAEVHMAVRQFLEDLRRFSSSMVTIESKFITIEDSYLQEIGVDFRGLDNPGTPFKDLDDVTNGLEDMAGLGLDNNGSGSENANASGPPSAGFFFDDGQDGDFKGSTSNVFDNPLGSALTNIGGLTTQFTFLNDLELSAILRAIEKSKRVELVNDQVLSVHNTQRAYVTVINQRAYIQDFDVEVATFEAVADPQINVLTEGIVLDVRPTIHQDRKWITLEIQPTVAEIVALDDFSTSLGGQTSPVSFQLPELAVKSIFTSAIVPDGGSILLGGLSRVRNIERRSEVPWLANIPLVGFFFKNEGVSDEKTSLMILIRAWITDVRDELNNNR